MKHFLILALSTALLSGCMVQPSVQSTEATPSASAVPTFDPTAAAKAVAFHQDRVKRDPQGALGWAMLADAQLSLASQKDDDNAAIAAEKAARTSLKLRRTNNGQAAVALTRSLLAQHRFSDAQTAVKDAAQIDPQNPGIKRLGMEIMLELGQYSGFKKVYPELEKMSDPASNVLKARWLSLTGRNKLAVQFMDLAVEDVSKIKTLPADTVAWYSVQQAATHHQAGNLTEAKTALANALEVHPESHQAWGWKTRIAAEESSWKEVLEFGEKASREAELTDIQGLMIRAERELGMVQESKARLDRLIEANGGFEQLNVKGHTHAEDGRHTHNRLFAMVLADLGLHTRFAHHLAEEDRRDRPDIYADDAFAWTTYRYWKLTPASETGEGDFLLKEAHIAIKSAMRTGSKDPMILRHAKEILSHTPK